MRSRTTRDAPQLNLGLPPEQPSDAALRDAFDQIDTHRTFEEFIADEARRRSLTNMARHLERQHPTRYRKDRP